MSCDLPLLLITSPTRATSLHHGSPDYYIASILSPRAWPANYYRTEGLIAFILECARVSISACRTSYKASARTPLDCRTPAAVLAGELLLSSLVSLRVTIKVAPVAVSVACFNG